MKVCCAENAGILAIPPLPHLGAMQFDLAHQLCQFQENYADA
jgi:hypothetical protein